MTQCPIIQDLLPLYIDDALSPESRALVAEHLSGCGACREAKDRLQAGGELVTLPPVEDAAPSDDARFLTRLKRQVGTVIGLSLLAMVLTAYGANRFGKWRADQEYGQKMETRRQEAEAALRAIQEASPDPLARLKASGVELTYSAGLTGDTLQLDFRLVSKAPADKTMTLAPVPGRTSPRVFDPATGKDLGRMRQASSGTSPGRPTEGRLLVTDVTEVPAGAKAQLPHLAVYLKPDRELKWEIRRPGEQGSVTIGERFAVAGVEFDVERVRFDGDDVQIDYRQVTPPKQVGLHLLTFRLSDRMGGNWGADTRLDELPDPLRPSQGFDFAASVSKNWSVEVEYAVLALPGPVIPVEVK